jgi:[Skp1-protein]-hydroxyproline N-acetylglucosaminyltransferase
VREIRLHYIEATGPCKARALAQTLWAGEGFFLQIDSHTRFRSGWDAALRAMLAEAEAIVKFGKAVISTYPSGFEVRSSLTFSFTICPTQNCSY